jgi:hypothetical protein
VDKKPLIGISICAVVLLVLGSLSNVVGYQSVKSTAMNDSPLFNIRTTRAIKDENKTILPSNYLGEGQVNYLQFPIRDGSKELIKDTIDKLSKMTEKQLDQLQEIIISYHYENKIDKVALDNFIFLLKQLKSNNIEIKSYLLNIKNGIKNEPPTFTGCITYSPHPRICNLVWFFAVGLAWLLAIITGIFFAIMKILTIASCYT